MQHEYAVILAAIVLLDNQFPQQIVSGAGALAGAKFGIHHEAETCCEQVLVRGAQARLGGPFGICLKIPETQAEVGAAAVRQLRLDFKKCAEIEVRA